MKNPFEYASSCWVKYSEYECRRAADGKEYVVPAKDAKPGVYDPLKNSGNLVVDALNVGMLSMNRAADAEVKNAVIEFVSSYGLLGLMTAIPTTPTFMDYEAVYLLKNQFIRDEAMDTEKYLSLFLPFEKLQFTKKGTHWRWKIEEHDMLPVGLTFHDKPEAQIMCFMREYGERYDWLVKQFKDWAFAFCSSFLYYRNGDALDEDTLADVPPRHGLLRRHRADVPHRAQGKTDHRVGLPFAASGRADDAHVHADGREKQHEALRKLPEGFPCQPAQRALLQSALQRSAQCAKKGRN
jgi:hypothetical protein